MENASSLCTSDGCLCITYGSVILWYDFMEREIDALMPGLFFLSYQSSPFKSW